MGFFVSDEQCFSSYTEPNGTMIFVQQPKPLLDDDTTTTCTRAALPDLLRASSSSVLSSASISSFVSSIDYGTRRVRFVEFVQVETIPRVEESAKDEVWYDQETLATIRRDNWYDPCTRGLENVPAKNSKQRRERLEKFMEAIMDEQINQWDEGESNPERLAQLSQELSASSREAAHKLGLEDEILG